MRRYSEASTSGLPPPPPPPQEAAESSSGGRRRGRKVAPEPKEPAEEGTAALPPMPGSPSFRYYCQKKTAAVDRIVADADAADADDSVRVRATARQLSNRCEITATKAHDSTEVHDIHILHGIRTLSISNDMIICRLLNLKREPDGLGSVACPSSLPLGTT